MKITRDQIELILAGLRSVAATAQLNADIFNIGKPVEQQTSAARCGSEQPRALLKSICLLPSVHEYVLNPKNSGDQTYWTRYTVEGSGEFPWDMLRSDESFPRAQEDATAMAGTNLRQITLKHVGDRKYWEPTAGRWDSFNWKVIGEAIQE